MNLRVSVSLIFILFLFACGKKANKAILTPWGETLGEDTTIIANNFSLDDIIDNGELIVLTLTGPDSYYDYHGSGMGTQYLLAEQFAKKNGVSLRVEVCKDTAEMINRLKNGEADVIAYQLPKSIKGVAFSGVGIDSLHTQWAVNLSNTSLADSLNRWFKPKMIAQAKSRESFLLSKRSVVRHIYASVLNRKTGVISRYDSYFQRYAPMAGWDWRLMAAQCYQESGFDPNAHSWAGARGLMQIMPGTAAELNLSMEMIHSPEPNIEAAARYIRKLDNKFSFVTSRIDRINFVLASYNGGFHHIKDAMSLTKKYGGNPNSWAEVAWYVLNLTTPKYYNDQVVKWGYMRGTETVEYVRRINIRWAQYCGIARGGGVGGFSSFKYTTPHRAKRKSKYNI